MVLVPATLLFLGLAAAQGEPAPDTRIAELFQVKWSSVSYYKTVRVANSEGSAPAAYASESLTLDCEVLARDPNLVLGICQNGIATQVTDSKGRNVEVPAPRYGGRSYTRLEYRERPLPAPRVARWRAFVQSVFRLRPKANSQPASVMKLEPVRVHADVGMGLLDQRDHEIRSVKGYFPALVAEAIEYVQVPFEPNEHWVSLTPDYEVKVKKASCDETSFRYDIEGHQLTQQRWDLLWSVESLPPSRIVLAQQFIAEDGKPVPSPAGRYYHWPFNLGESGWGNLTNGRIKAIRFVIAVNPSHRQIRFELQHIPLPDPEQPTACTQKNR
jgi:hypothetical protein